MILPDLPGQYQENVVPVIDPSGAAVLPLWQGSLAPFIAPKSLPYSRVLQAPQEQKLVVEPPIWKTNRQLVDLPQYFAVWQVQKKIETTWNHHLVT